MPVPQSKNELISAIQKEFKKVREEFEKIPLGNCLDKTMEGHAKDTFMSPHNLLSYLIGWNELVLKWHEKAKCGEEIDFPETGYKWNQLGLLAQKFYLDYEEIDFQDLLKIFFETKENLLKLIESHSNEELYGVPWYEQWTMGRMIQFNTSSPYNNATRRLRKWQKSHNEK